MLASLAGILAGLAAAGLEYGLHVGSTHLVGRFTDLGNAGVANFRIAILFLPALGGLVAGLAVWFLAPRLEGHGTDLLIRGFHYKGGKLGLRGPIANAVAAVSVISCGGSAGPEGPIAALGAAIGSNLGRFFSLTPRERRVMLVAGCGAGIGAIFQCPLGGALFAASVLYRESDYESDAVVPAFVASVVGYSAYMPFWGYGTHLLREADKLAFTHPLELLPFAVLGPLCGLTCGLFRFSLRSTERLASRFPRGRWIAPVVGGLATGAIACLVPQVMDGQYVFIQKAMDGSFAGGLDAHSWVVWALLFASVAIAKCLATGFTIGSGAPGGVLGPSVFIGGALGAFVGALMMTLSPEAFAADPENLRRALIPVGMAGVLSASMRVPLAAVVMAVEMTGGYGLIVPLMLVCVTSYVVGRRWGLNDQQVPTSAESPAHAGDLIVHMLEMHTVGELVRDNPNGVVQPGTTLNELAGRLQPGVQPTFVVVESDRIVGLISVPEIESGLDSSGAGSLVVAADMMTPHVPTLRRDDSLYSALSTMSRSKQSALPVVGDDGKRFIGMIARSQIHKLVRHQLADMSKHLFEEHAGLAAIEHEDDVYHLAAQISPGSVARVQRLLVPIQAIGKSLREADFRRNFGVHVIAIEQPDGSVQCPPDVDAPLNVRCRLLAVSTETPAPDTPSSAE